MLLTLNTADFTTAIRMADAINKDFQPGPEIAAALDGRAIRVLAPHGPSRVAFMSRLENLQVEPAHASARVIINARTGSIVMNQQVSLEMCSISHGNLTVVIKPEAKKEAGSETRAEGAAPVVDVKVAKENQAETGHLLLVPKSVSLNEVIRALNSIGATPKDLLAILQAMKASGALRAELEII